MKNNKMDIYVPSVIECIDVVIKNPRDSDKRLYSITTNVKETIQWCRRNFGARGDGWDFIATYKKADIAIWSSKLIVMYELWKR